MKELEVALTCPIFRMPAIQRFIHDEEEESHEPRSLPLRFRWSLPLKHLQFLPELDGEGGNNDAAAEDVRTDVPTLMAV